MAEEAVAATRVALGDELATGGGLAMVDKFGGVERCLRRYVADFGDPASAAAAIRNTIAFRAEHQVDTIEDRITANGTLAKVQPYWFSAFSPKAAPDGSPILFYKGSVVDPALLMDKLTEDEFRDYYLFWMEKGLQLQLASIEKGDTPPGCIEIYDISGVGYSQLHISGLRLLSRVLGLGQVHYPGNLTKGFMINAPWFFSTGYEVIKPVLSSATIAALTIASDDCRDELIGIMVDPVWHCH